MAKKPYLIAVVVLVFISSMAFFFISTPSQDSKRLEQEILAEASLPSLPLVTLSSEANFPSPVIALQQTLAHGMIEVEKTKLPLLSGELNQFSQTNITEDYSSPTELEELKQRLNKLPSSNQ
ncbi:hypothetical protein F0225_01155 [Vibrio pectenicida]|uniref:Uncharacterized protein n=1 Tax=Vibrio pectenicida TaxID=62763 RepID=A0A7Y4EBT3_9VIBR|nr:hypothetical protein [Vibrio pectenicida]